MKIYLQFKFKNKKLLISILISGIFYFTLGNIPPSARSKLSSINLLAITKEKHLKKYGMDTILKPIVNDLKRLVSICWSDTSTKINTTNYHMLGTGAYT